MEKRERNVVEADGKEWHKMWKQREKRGKM